MSVPPPKAKHPNNICKSPNKLARSSSRVPRRAAIALPRWRSAKNAAPSVPGNNQPDISANANAARPACGTAQPRVRSSAVSMSAHFIEA